MKFSQIFTATASLIIFNQACSKLIEIERSQHFLKNEDLERIFGENADQTSKKDDKDKSCYQILQITDPQIGMRDQYGFVATNFIGEKIGREGYKDELNNVYKALDKVLAMEKNSQTFPKFIIITGDIINAYPWMPHRNSQIQDMKKAFTDEKYKDLNILVIPGNHDIKKDFTAEEHEKLYVDNWGSSYYHFGDRGLGRNSSFETHYFALDSNLFRNTKNSSDRKAKALADKQLKWFKRNVSKVFLRNKSKSKSKSLKNLIIFMHHPIYHHWPKESFQTYYYDTLPYEYRYAILDILEPIRRQGIDVHFYSGHLHTYNWSEKTNKWVNPEKELSVTNTNKNLGKITQESSLALSMNFYEKLSDKTPGFKDYITDIGGGNFISVCDGGKVSSKFLRFSDAW